MIEAKRFSHVTFETSDLERQIAYFTEVAGLVVAEGVGFEPTIRFPVYTLSKRAPSATRPPLRARDASAI
jgi:catechol 2,3-dioxygenase-like lactoylglutathione lyase family enzyme